MSDSLHRTAFKRLIGNNPRYFILSHFSYNQLLYLQFRQSWQLERDGSGEIFPRGPQRGPLQKAAISEATKKRMMFGISPPRLPWCLGTPWMRRKTTCSFVASCIFPTRGFSDHSLLCWPLSFGATDKRESVLLLHRGSWQKFIISSLLTVDLFFIEMCLSATRTGPNLAFNNGLCLSCSPLHSQYQAQSVPSPQEASSMCGWMPCAVCRLVTWLPRRCTGCCTCLGIGRVRMSYVHLPPLPQRSKFTRLGAQEKWWWGPWEPSTSLPLSTVSKITFPVINLWLYSFLTF